MLTLFKIAVLPVILPLLSAPLAVLIWKARGRFRDYFSAGVVLVTFAVTLALFPIVSRGPIQFVFLTFPGFGGVSMSINIDLLALVMISLISFLGFLASIFSISYMKEHRRQNSYYAYLLLFIGSMNGAVIAGDLFTMFLFWEFMTVSAFFLVIFENSESAVSAGKKYFIMSEAGALCMLVSIISIFLSKGTVDMGALSAHGSAGLSSVSYVLPLLFLIGLGVKAGVVPLHTWLPDAHPAAPSPISALLSGVMIKVGVYMMIRIFCQIFAPVVSWQFILCALGSVTILVGVMMALIQHDAKRLLAYHSVSQVGYMVLGIGTGTAIGLAGGLFHLVNHALFKGLLFLCMGGVIFRMKTRDLSEFGGLANFMPITFVTCLIAALSISGVPPFNGFVSKWMIYQGLIEMGKTGGSAWIIWLVAAMFGSALTLASFMKLIHATFLGQRSSTTTRKRIREVHWTMWIPMVILAGLCLVFGIFAFTFPLRHFILPSIRQLSTINHQLFPGFWQPGLAAILIVVGLVIGALIYLLGKAGKVREDKLSYVGGEIIPEENRVNGVDFYKTVEEMGFLRVLYRRAEEKWFDIYEVGKKLAFYFTSTLRDVHTGLLPFYLLWTLVGMAVIILSFLLGGK